MQTFVVRVVDWSPGEPLRGLVQAVGDDEQHFRDDAELIAALQRRSRSNVRGGES